MAAASPRRLANEEILFLQGDPVGELLLIECGQLRLSQISSEGEEVVVRVFGPGAIVAGLAILEGRTFPVTGTAVGETRLLAWPRARLLELIERHPRLRDNILSTIADRMHQSLARVRELATGTAEQRLALALLRLLRERGRPIEGGILIDQLLGRQQLADLADTSMFTASRVLARWAREGLLEVGRQRVVVCSTRRLAQLAGSQISAAAP